MDFSTLIQNWFRRNKRDLPWRSSKSPYKIWLSEIILQQTRVEQGTAYYLKFIDAFPKVEDLANADEDYVLNLWQGLGYYSRARNLQASAKIISNDLNGVFPKDYETILELKGVGDYTASAICSIAYNLPHAVVDGNVYRVLSRYLKIDTAIDSTKGKKEFKQAAGELLDANNPGDHNQALMELGALICTPRKPNCENCPLKDSCLSYKDGNPLDYPVKSKKIKVQNRSFNFLVITDGKFLFIKKRLKKDIWFGLYDFPSLEEEGYGDVQEALTQFKSKNYFLDVELKHILSHQKIQAKFWVLKVDEMPKSIFDKIKRSDIEDFPLPQLLIRYINSSELFGAE